MNNLHTVLSAAITLTLVSGIAAQEVPKFPEPTQEHQWLKQFVGEWDTTAEGIAAPGQPAMTCKGKMSTRMLGGFWAISDVENEVSGMKIQAVQTIGYDATKKKYVGSWVDSMLNHLWKYEGTVDAKGKTLTLEAEGPNMMVPGKTAKYRDAYEFESKDHIIATSSMLGDDGKWTVFMTGHCRRKK